MLDHSDRRDLFERAVSFDLKLPSGVYSARLLNQAWSPLPGWTRVDVDLHVFGGLLVLGQVEHEVHGRWLVCRMRRGIELLVKTSADR